MASPQIVLVTGGNNGIGYETVKALFEADKPYHVLLGSRSLEKAKKAIEKLHEQCPASTNTVEAVHVDLTSDESIERAYAQIEADHGHIDALVNNAGATFDLEYLAGKVSLRECFTKAYDVNLAGTHVLTATLIPLLLKSSDPRLRIYSVFNQGMTGVRSAFRGNLRIMMPRGDFFSLSLHPAKMAMYLLLQRSQAGRRFRIHCYADHTRGGYRSIHVSGGDHNRDISSQIPDVSR
ncbi:hypothetical protein DFH06DRAFT_988064 [Mycena polygramma]|nr:hypothetical protein DFH06DRAFT_988064 [Mycena polygramma]